MQNCVQRDPVTGASNYAMMACNPIRIVGEGNPTFAGQALAEIVDSISKESGRLLQIVNHNVAGQQYVAAGDLVALTTLGNVLNFIKIQKIDLKKLNEIMPIEDVREKLAEIVREVLANAIEEEKKGRIELKRGFATILFPVSTCLSTRATSLVVWLLSVPTSRSASTSMPFDLSFWSVATFPTWSLLPSSSPSRTPSSSLPRLTRLVSTRCSRTGEGRVGVAREGAEAHGHPRRRVACLSIRLARSLDRDPGHLLHRLQL